jgi:hypothetical protein
MTTSSWRLLLVATLALVGATAASAQTTGTIIGVVTDAPTGKPVAGALVVATSPFLQGPQTGLTDGTGAFRIALLPPGDYRIAVQLEGYLPAERSDLTLRLDMTLRANLVTINQNFGRARAYQQPLAIRFGLELALQAIVRESRSVV